MNNYGLAGIILLSVLFGTMIFGSANGTGTLARDEKQELLRVVHYSCEQKSAACEMALKNLEKFHDQ